jgi:predicted DNA-binding transcriptional regulator AlpA
MHGTAKLPQRRRLTASQVLARYGGASEMWLWRRVNGLGGDATFPRPIVICGRRFFDEAELDAYDEAHRLPAEAVA